MTTVLSHDHWGLYNTGGQWAIQFIKVTPLVKCEMWVLSHSTISSVVLLMWDDDHCLGHDHWGLYNTDGQIMSYSMYKFYSPCKV